MDGVGGVVFERDEDDVALDAGGIVGHGLAGGDAGGEIEGEKGFAETGVAVEDGEFAKRDAVGPEPVKLLRDDV